MIRATTRTPIGCLIACLIACLLAAPLAPSTAITAAPGSAATTLAARDVNAPRPLIYDRSFADPTVATDGTHWLGAATGWRARASRSLSEYGTWQAAGELLTARPAWATYAGVWAPDLEQARDGSWLLYYSMPTKGMTHHQDRCIGVATAPDLNSQFTPIGGAPLVCPSWADTEPAGDQLAGRSPGLPKRGVIDPSAFVAPDGRRFLLYRTQGVPSTIRMVPLTNAGTRTRGVSTEILHDDAVLENPAMVADRGWFYLLTSRGDYGSCRYRTVWRRSTDLRRGWQGSPDRILLSRQTTGVCGPGGADYMAATATRPNRVFFHGWVCRGTNSPCHQSYAGHQDYEDVGTRALYAVRIKWTTHGPRIGSFAQGPPWTPPPEEPVDPEVEDER